MPPHAKLVGLLTFVVSVVSVPAHHAGALLGLLAVAVAVVLGTSVHPRYLVPRLAVEVPFAAFAVVLPFVATGPRVEIGPVTVSQPGLDAAVALLLKGTCGVLAAVAYAVTTPTSGPAPRPPAPAPP